MWREKELSCVRESYEQREIWQRLMNTDLGMNWMGVDLYEYV